MKKELIIRKGYCLCGCGQKTKLNNKFLTGHNLKHWIKTKNGGHSTNYKGGRTITPAGYVLVQCPGHPRANRNNYVPKHILVAEKVLGKYLPKKVEVHHANENRSDNTHKNLVICENHKYHSILHQRIRAKKECGHANWRKCGFCKSYDDPKNMVIKSNDHNEYVAYHRICHNKYYSKIWRKHHDNRANKTN